MPGVLESLNNIRQSALRSPFAPCEGFYLHVAGPVCHVHDMGLLNVRNTATIV